MTRTSALKLHRLALPFAVVTAIAVAGCTSGASPESSSSGPSTTAADSGFLLVAGEDQPYGLTALVSGRLEIDTEDRCVRIVADYGETMPLIFEFGTTLDTDQLAVVLPDGRRFADGDSVTVTGGASPPPVFGGDGYLSHINVPESCWAGESPENRRVWIVNPFGWSIEHS